MMKKANPIAFFLIIIFFYLNLPLSAQETEPYAYLDSLIRQAIEKKLPDQRFWRLLIHYKKDIFGRTESEEDGAAFFNSPIGKTNPQEELIETLRSFFGDPGQLKKEEEHPQCNFPARYKWLKSELSMNSNLLPEQRCVRLEGWLEKLDPEKITLVFATYYMNNPASMFGHTLLRIDKKRDGPDQTLLNYGVNYTANADTKNPIAYVLKGLFGAFEGTFSIFPYYTKVQEYSNWESRDLWEYELNFTEDQMNYFLLHLWELGGNYFDYYYFQENCSYHILSLLEVANPDLYLTDQFFFHVIPADTIKALMEYPDLISKQVYRPSLLNQMNQKIIQMSPHEQDIFHRLTKNSSLIEHPDYLGLTVAEKALVLDATLDYAQYQNKKNKGSSVVIDKETRSILLERSRLGYQRKDPPDIVHFSTPPELSHGSARFGLGFGRNENGHLTEIALRPAYHDLLAKDTGYSKDSQILFLDLVVRYYHKTNETKLDSASLIDIISLTPYDALFQKKSWKLSIKIDTIRDIDCNLCNSFKLNYGLGIAYQRTYFPHILLYSFMDFEGEASRHLESNFRLGGGISTGILLALLEDWRVQALGKYLNFPLGNNSSYYEASIHLRYAITQNMDFRAGLNRLKKNDERLISLNLYF